MLQRYSGCHSGYAARSLTACGISPQCLEDHVGFLGNTLRSCVCMAFVSQHARKAMKGIFRKIDYVELSTRPGYTGCLQPVCVFHKHTQSLRHNNTNRIITCCQ
ncbi:DUF4445 domain-containing protein [Desulfovibrio desulfuricans]|uniref:ASKHA domain-containing protein n=1 Tax=Desulfovibrio desulfuricans TaxID=876 RepID=UPI00177EF054|nr:DUF4445 domain-containing protein [Desulfovibrio desulfuricans]